MLNSAAREALPYNIRLARTQREKRANTHKIFTFFSLNPASFETSEAPLWWKSNFSFFFTLWVSFRCALREFDSLISSRSDSTHTLFFHFPFRLGLSSIPPVGWVRLQCTATDFLTTTATTKLYNTQNKTVIGQERRDFFGTVRELRVGTTFAQEIDRFSHKERGRGGGVLIDQTSAAHCVWLENSRIDSECVAEQQGRGGNDGDESRSGWWFSHTQFSSGKLTWNYIFFLLAQNFFFSLSLFSSSFLGLFCELFFSSRRVSSTRVELQRKNEIDVNATLGSTRSKNLSSH